MKQLLLILTLLSSAAAFGQSRSDYERIMADFKRYYNNGNDDSIQNMFSDMWKDKKSLWNDPGNKSKHADWGIMRSYEYEGIDSSGAGTMENKVRFFLVTFDKTTHAMSFLLDEKNKLLTFRPMTMTDFINSKLSRYYKGKGEEFYKSNK